MALPKKPQTREERLAAALRENLKRRKQAARAGNPPPRAGVPRPEPHGPNSAKKPE